MVFRLTLTQRERAQVLRATRDLLVSIERAGLTVRKERLVRAWAEYRRESKEIVEDVGRHHSFIPAILERLLTLAHEFGHHLSHENHKKVGRFINYDYTPHTLFEEYRAWQEAARLLFNKLGLKGRKFREAFTMQMGNAIACNVADFEAHFWLTERLDRLKIHCPVCISRGLMVLGADSAKYVQIVCQHCGAHTQHRASVLSVSKRLEKSTFADICSCKDHL